MTEIHSKNTTVIYVCYGLGLALILVGALITVRGFNRAGRVAVPVVKDHASDTNKTDLPESRPVYRLRYSADHWSLQPVAGGPLIALPSFLPGPSLCSAPRGPAPIEEIRAVFLDCLERNRFPLTRDRYFALINVQAAGKDLFPDRKRLEALLPDGREPKPDRPPLAEQKKTEKEPTAPANPISGETGPGLDSIPDRLKPDSDSFLKAMSSWKNLVAEPLRGVAPQNKGYVLKIAVQPNDEQALLFSGRARERVLSDDFGSSKRDRAIYMQALFGEPDFLIDGAFGANSKKTLKRWAERRFANRDLAAEYQKLVEAYF